MSADGRSFGFDFTELVVDSFAGGGGASTGIRMALGRCPDVAVNHDGEALAMHEANHPDTQHIREDVWAVDPMRAMGWRQVGLLWASPDCKHFSKAKGGKPVSKKIRGLAWVITKWASKVKPRVIIMENVEEFRTWGPLIKIDGKWYPDPARKGQTYERFLARLRKLGYAVEARELRACDYGAPTIRKRLFLIARRDRRPIIWPAPTHGSSKNLQVQAGRLQPYRTAADCIDWTIPCPSIFERKKPLAEATLRRIARGVMRYVVNSDKPFIVPIANYGSGLRVNGIDEPLTTITANPKGGAHAVCVPVLQHATHGGRSHNIAGQMPTITSAPRGELELVSATLVQTGYGEREGQAPRALDIKQPLGTVVGGGAKHALVAATIVKHNFGDKPCSHAGDPLHTVTTQGNKHALVTAFLAQHNTMPNGGIHAGHAATDPVSTISASGAQQNLVTSHLIKLRGTCKDGQSVDDPAPTITGGGTHAGEVRAFLIKYYGAEQAPELDDPMHTVTSKHRFGLVYIHGEPYQIVDIGMRMLSPRELANAQGFPANYIIDRGTDGKPLTKTAQVRMIGNSVCPPLAAALVAANFTHEQKLQVAA